MSNPKRDINRNNSVLAIDSLRYLLKKIRIKTKAIAHAEMILDKALKESLMVAILGEEGIGKSSCVASYVFANQNVYYIKMGRSYNAKGLFHELIFLITGEFPFPSMGMQTSISFLSRILIESPGKKLVIIDEAGKLTASTLELFHELRDNTRDTAGFAFLGPQYFRENLLEWKSKGKIGIGEFYRRIEYWYTLPDLIEEEKWAYCKSREVEPNAQLRGILKEVKTIWEIEARINIYLEGHKKK